MQRPTGARAFTTRRRVRLSDMDAGGRLRLDAVARFLQDAAIDDVAGDGVGCPRAPLGRAEDPGRRARAAAPRPRARDRDVVQRRRRDRGRAAVVASRVTPVAVSRSTASGSISIPASAPTRIGDFGPYAAAAGGRTVSTKLVLPDPPGEAARSPVAAAVDRPRRARARQQRRLLAGARGSARPGRDEPDGAVPGSARLPGTDRPRRRRRARRFRSPTASRCDVAFVVGDRVKAVASIESLPGR